MGGEAGGLRKGRVRVESVTKGLHGMWDEFTTLESSGEWMVRCFLERGFKVGSRKWACPQRVTAEDLFDKLESKISSVFLTAVT